MVGRLITPAVAALFLAFAGLRVQGEETFSVLQIGTQTYQNVTVTTKAKNYVFLMHSAGMTTVKVAELPKELRLKLGYPEEDTPKLAKSSGRAWAKQTLAKLDVPQIKGVKEQFTRSWSAGNFTSNLPVLATQYVFAALAVVLGLYLFSCYCAMLICRKTGIDPGIWVWFPVLQTFPMLAAAGMSPWWFVGLMVPGLNLVGGVLWAFKIACARSKGPLTAVMLLLPVFNFLAFVYLAFSDSAKARDDDRRVEIMTLETA